MLDIVFSNKLESKFQQKLLIENYHSYSTKLLLFSTMGTIIDSFHSNPT